MTDIIGPLRGEIVRLARKELKGHLETLRATVGAHRKEIAALKRDVGELRKQLKMASKQQKLARGAEPTKGASKNRISSKGIISLRKRLGISAADLGKLLGVSGATIYIWESKTPTPKPDVMSKLAELRMVGKKEVWKRLGVT